MTKKLNSFTASQASTSTVPRLSFKRNQPNPKILLKFGPGVFSPPLHRADRSHNDLVRIQHVIASTIDPDVEEPESRADRLVDGDIAAIWEFETEAEESDCLAQWIERELQAANVEPHDIAIIVRMRADEVEGR